MKKSFSIIILIVANVLFVSLYGQVDTIPPLPPDTAFIEGFPVAFEMSDTLTHAEVQKMDKEIKLKVVKEFQPDPTKAVIYSAIFPGLGQIYNRKYWKLPIVYGGFLGVVYAVSWNGNMHTDYQDAYKDLMLYDKPGGEKERWKDFIYKGEWDKMEVLAERKTKTDFLKRRRDYFRRNRDLAVIVGVGLYALCMIDAYVDANLYNFSVTPDLSMTVAPVIWGPSNFSTSVSVGFQCNIVF